MALDPNQLLALDRRADSNLTDLARQEPNLFQPLSKKATDQRKETVTAAFDGVSAALRTALSKVDLSVAAAKDKPLRDVILDSLAAQRVPAEVAREAVGRLVDLDRSASLQDPAAVNVPIREHPLFQSELQQAGVVKMALASRLDTERAGRIVQTVDSPNSIDDEAIGRLVRTETVNSRQATDLGLTASLYHLVDDDLTIAQGLAVGLSGDDDDRADIVRRADDRDGGRASVNRLATLGTDGWLRAIRRGNVVPPQGKTAEEFAAQLDHTVSAVFPTDALLTRVQRDGGPRATLLAQVQQLNPNAELLALSYTAGSQDLAQLNFGNLTTEQRATAIADLKAYQRAFALTEDAGHAYTLVRAGYSTALAVGTGTFETFQARTQLPEQTARLYHDQARTTVSKVTTATTSIVDLIRGGFDHLSIANLPPSILDYLRKIDGFDDLFGSQDYCACSHCQSIIGPAAYFVDLMAFVEEHVSEVYFTGARADHVLNLRTRRPDLWTMPLTCESTNTLIPYLDIINEVLENYLARRLGFGGALTDRAAVETFVYRQRLSNAFDSFRQPYSLPLAKLTAYLAHFERQRGEVAAALSVPAATTVAATLGLSQREYQIVTQPSLDQTVLRRIYGINFNFAGSGIADPVDAQDLVRTTGLSRDEWGALAETRFVSANGAEAIEFRTAKRSPDSVQNDIERVHGLRVGSLDRLHRMARLDRVLPWSVGALDLVLTEAAATGVPAGIGEPMLATLVHILAVGRRFKLSVEQNCALWGPIPRTALPGVSASLFDRLFNLPTFVRLDGTLPKDAVSFVHPSQRTAGVPSPADNTLHRMLAGLGVADEQLAQLIAALAGPLGANPSAPNEQDRGFLLTATNLTLLYRHARLAQLLRLPVPDLFQLIDLAGLTGHVASLADLTALLAFYDWWHSSGYTLDDLALVTGDTVRQPSRYPDPVAVAADIVARVAADHAIEFADTVFAFVPGVTEEQSRALVAANISVLQRLSDGRTLRLTPTFDPAAALTVPTGVTAPESQLRAALLDHHASTVLPPRLASQLGLPVDKVGELVAMSGTALSSAGIVTALHGGSIAPLEALATELVPLAVLFRPKVFDATVLAFVRTHAAIFGATDLTAVDLAAVRALSGYAKFAARLIAAQAAQQATVGDAAPDLSDLHQVLSTFDPTTWFAGTDQGRLATVLETEPAMVATLLPHLALPTNVIDALSTVDRAVLLATSLGVGGDALALIVSDDYDDLNRAAEAVLSAIRAKYPDEEEFANRLDPFADRVRAGRRDALTDYLIRSVHPEFDELDELYQHFLLDVQLDGCARTSRLVAAISSVQLYVHRVLINLEQDRREPADPQHLAVPVGAIPADEWQWRKNYRVWEANRKVFLWPENYIEPELRDDKTPLFEELESTLLQQDVNEQNVLDAYASYLAGFEEVAGLQIAGAYHDKDAFRRTDVLHLFGVTPGDPPVFYYRTVDNAIYGETEPDRGTVYRPWKKIDVQIPVRRVAPVIHLGRLFVFWTELVTTPKNEVKDAGSQFVGYRHRLTLKYTTLRLDGRWSPPQAVSLSGTAFPTGEGIVEDPLAEQSERDAFTQAVASFDFQAAYNAMTAMATPRFDNKVHPEPIDGYTLKGFQWDRVYPQRSGGDLRLTGRNFQMRAGVDFYHKSISSRATLNIHLSSQRLLAAKPEGSVFRVYSGRPVLYLLDDYPQSMVVADSRRIDTLGAIAETKRYAGLLRLGLYTTPLAHLFLPPEITVINGSLSDAVVDLNGDLFYVRGSAPASRPYSVRRLGTTLGETMSRLLFAGGVDALLHTPTQRSMQERFPMFWPGAGMRNDIANRLDFRGAFGTYFREVYFHIPFLIANHLNGQQRFAAAQQWYHYIFNPTANETITVPAGTPPAEAARRRLDRVWRYSEFRGLDVPSMRQILTDPAAIEVYKKDPFNPHAIARLRLSAYQKCIVMKYVDNLLDWGDSLFTQFTMESVNEATMLYVLASDILGRRPAKLGTCGEAAVVPRTYEKIGPLVRKGSEFLVELESLLWFGTRVPLVYGPIRRAYAFALDRGTVRYFSDRVVARFAARPVETISMPPELVEASPEVIRDAVGGGSAVAEPARPPRGVATVRATPAGEDVTAIHVSAALDRASVESSAMRAAATRAAAANVVDDVGIARFTDWNRTYTASVGDTAGRLNRPGRVVGAVAQIDRPLILDFARVPAFGWGFIRQVSPVFCIPQNPDLLGYWDRVEDRLFKLRHCIDITGVRRQLALFAPEIDPRLLVRARAAGLSIEDVLGTTSGDLPPYRFTYLIEKAKQHAAAVQSFGGSLLAALEKKDLEELNRLRTVHQQNLLKLTTRVREWEIDIASRTIETLDRQREAVEYRRGYFDALLQEDLNPQERTQQISRHVASASFIGGALLSGTAGVLSLIPQIGSPFAMKYGGVELGSSVKAWGAMLSDTARVAEVVAASAGLEAGFARRREGWEHQRKLAAHELKQLEKHSAAAELRKQIATRSLAIHQAQLEQLDEIFTMFGARFSNLALYTWLAATMQRLYREAFHSAFATARLAEQAYRFERNDDTTTLLRTGHYDATRAGLLAGEQLLLDLEAMERRFIETNYRTPEVDQSFSLAQVDSAALMRLRETGECDFDLPEVFFDLFYPGHYRRRIKSVRLSVPCVTGPYTNIPASLALTGSKIRRDPTLGAEHLLDVPLRRSVAIATSTGQNDSGVFEFSFRDERYMPFEGAGAVSSWQLTLPKTFRPFDYQTITDVIVHISYTAESDGLLRDAIEELDATIDGTIANYLSANGLARTFSLRQEFSSALNRLVHSAAGTPVPIEITDRHLSIFLRGRDLQISSAKLVLRTPPGQSVAGVSVHIGGTTISGFATDPDLGGVWSADASAAFAGGLLGDRTFTVVAAGDLAPDTPVPGDASALDEAKLSDILLHVELGLA